MPTNKEPHILRLDEINGAFQLGPVSKVDLMLSQDRKHVGFRLHLQALQSPSNIPTEFFVELEAAMALMQALQELKKQFGLPVPKIATTTTRRTRDRPPKQKT
jgi:hypothetical protein